MKRFFAVSLMYVAILGLLGGVGLLGVGMGVASIKGATAANQSSGGDTGGFFTGDGSYWLAGKQAISSTNPTLYGSGFGTAPSVTPLNGTLSFRINVGTGGTAASGVVAMPVAYTGWNCLVHPSYPIGASSVVQAAAVAYASPQVSAVNATNAITIINYTQSTGALLAWTASTLLDVSCVGD